MLFPDDFSDDDLLLALCIRPEELDDPAAWCRDFRLHHQAIKDGPKTSEEAHVMMAAGATLFGRINKEIPVQPEPFTDENIAGIKKSRFKVPSC